MTDHVNTFLKSIRRKRHELMTISESAAELRASLLPAGIRYDRDRVQTSPEEKLSEVVADLVRIEKIQQKQIARLKEDLILAEQLISAMPTSECRELIRLRYLAGKVKPLTWAEVAERMGYSEDHARGKLHDKAIAEAQTEWTRLKENTPEHKI